MRRFAAAHAVSRSARRLGAVLAVVALVAGLLPLVPGPAQAMHLTLPFWDVMGTDLQDPVAALYQIGVVGGTSPRTFSPGDSVTRAQMTAFAVRAATGQNNPANAGSAARFGDVPRSHWAFGAISAGVELGIVKGVSETSFKPDDPVTYEQVLAFILRAAALDDDLNPAFGYPLNYVQKAVDLGLLEGVDFRLGKPATRGDVARLLAKAIFNAEDPDSNKTLSQRVFRKASAISITPGSGVILPGVTQLRAVGQDYGGREVTPTVAWQVQGADATIDAAGRLTVTTGGTVVVTATAGELRATATYSVVSGLRITVPAANLASDGSAYMGASETVSLRAEAVGATGPVSGGLVPAWSVVSGPGRIDVNGRLTATGRGRITVRAQAGAAAVEQVLIAVDDLQISSSLTLGAPGETVSLEAKATVDGRVTAVPATWSLDRGGASVTPAAGAVGRATVALPGTGPLVVRASLGGASATATVQVIERIEISPSGKTVPRATQEPYSAVAVTSDGSRIPITPSWDVQPFLGVMGGDGKFAATQAGRGEIIATYRGLTARVPVTVAGEAVSLALSLSQQSIPANGRSTVTVTARALDSAGNPTSLGVTNLLFSLSSSLYGSLGATQVPVENGQAQVTFTASEQSGSVNVVVSAPGTTLPGAVAGITTYAPVPARIELSAYPSPLNADATSLTTITATLVDSTGAPVRVSGSSLNVALSNSNPAVASLLGTMISIPTGQSSGSVQMRAGATLGATSVSGTSTYLVVPVTVTTVNVGPAAALVIRPGIAPTRADNTAEMVVQAEVRDASGYIRTNDNSTVVSLSAQSGTTSLTVPAATVQNGVATFRLRTTVAGTYTLRATASPSGAGLLSSPAAEAVFTPGPAARLALSVEPTNVIAADLVSTVRVVARIVDAYGNPVPTAGATVTFSRSSGSYTFLPDSLVVNTVNGAASISVRATSGVGTDTFTASASGLTAQPSSVTVQTRITGVPVRLDVQPITPASPRAGQTVQVKVAVLDTQGYVVTSDNGRAVSLLFNSPTASVVSSGVTDTGVATFTVTDTRAGTLNIRATTSGLQADNTGENVTFAAGAAARVVLVASPPGLAADGTSRSAITAQLQDDYGNSAGSPPTVTLSLSDSRYGTLSSPYLYPGGTVYVTSTLSEGSFTITGTASGYAVQGLTMSTYRPGVPTRVVVDPPTSVTAGNGAANQMRVRVRIVDQNGNQATQLNTGAQLSAIGVTVTGMGATGTTTISVSNTTGLPERGFNANGQTTGAAAAVYGEATFIFTNTRAETVTFTPVVYYNGAALTASPATGTTLPGPAAQLVIGPANAVFNAQFATGLSLTATISDVYGNPVTGAAEETVSFTFSTTDYLTPPGNLTVSTVNGVATLPITTRVHATGGRTTVTARSSSGLNASSLVITDLPPAQPTVWAYDANGIDTTISGGEVGARVTVSAPVRQADQRVTVYVNGVAVTLYSSTSFSTPVDTIASGTSALTGYIRLADLGGVGQKQIYAYVQTGLGLSPASNTAVVNVQ